MPAERSRRRASEPRRLPAIATAAQATASAAPGNRDAAAQVIAEASAAAWTNLSRLGHIARPPALRPAVCIFGADPVCSARRYAFGEGRRAQSLRVPAAGADAGRGRCRRESRRDIADLHQGPQALLLRLPELPRAATRCARSRTRSRGSGGTSAGRRPSRRSSCCRISPTTATPTRIRRRTTCSPSTWRRSPTRSRRIPASERMYQLMNHELVHVVQGDMATEEDKRWRRFFLGKVDVSSRDPESMFYSYLTHAAPHGAALVRRRRRGLPRDVDGGRARPRARGLRRDGVPGDGPGRRPFLRSAGARLAGIARRFPDRRERVPLRHALLHLARVRLFAREGPRVAQARRRKRTLLLRPVPEGIRPVARSGLAAIGSRSSTSSSDATSPRSASFRSPRTGRWREARSGPMSRTYYDEATGMLYAGFRYPGVVEYVGALNTRDGSIKRTRGNQAGDAVQGDVARLRRFQRDRLLHQRQPRRRLAPRSHGGRRADRRGARADSQRARSARSSSIPSTRH